MMIASLFEGLDKFLERVIDFEIRNVADDEMFQSLLGYLEHYIDDMPNFENVAQLSDWMHTFDRLVWATFVLNDNDYESLIGSKWGDNFVREEAFVTSKAILFEDYKVLIIYEFIRNDAEFLEELTIEDLKLGIDDAVAREDYEHARELDIKLKQLENASKR